MADDGLAFGLPDVDVYELVGSLGGGLPRCDDGLLGVYGHGDDFVFVLDEEGLIFGLLVHHDSDGRGCEDDLARVEVLAHLATLVLVEGALEAQHVRQIQVAVEVRVVLLRVRLEPRRLAVQHLSLIWLYALVLFALLLVFLVHELVFFLVISAAVVDLVDFALRNSVEAVFPLDDALLHTAFINY